MLTQKQTSHIILLLLLSVFSSIAISMNGQQTYMWNNEHLRDIKEHPSEYESLINQCKQKADYYLRQKCPIITDKPKSFVKDSHNYASLSIYYWPNPRDSLGRYIHIDGRTNPDYKKYDAGKLESLTSRLRYLSIGYYLTESSSYRSCIINTLNSWFIDKSTYMYPNLEYAQIAPGHNNNHGNPAGIIEAYNFNHIIESIRLTNSINPLPTQMMRQLKKWFSKLSKWLIESDNGKHENATNTNHGIAYDVLLLNIHLFCTGKLDNEIVNAFYPHRLSLQISSDGSQPEELKRSRSIHYCLYNLSHILDFCMILKNEGTTYYNENRLLIDKAFIFLEPFIEKKSSYPYKEISDWSNIVNNYAREQYRLNYIRGISNKSDINYQLNIEYIYI